MNLKFKAAQLAAYIFLRLYGHWSRLHRLLGWRYRGVVLSTYGSVEDLAKNLEKLHWRKDRWNFWNPISMPQRIEHVLQFEINKKVFNSDAPASYVATSLVESDVKGRLLGNFDFVGALIMTILYQNVDGSFGGRNVALLGFETSFSYMDYGLPSQKRTHIGEVVEDALTAYSPGGKLLACGIYDIDFALEEISLSTATMR